MFVKHYASGVNKIRKKTIYSTKVKVKVIDFGVIWKDIITWVILHTKYAASISYGSKVLANVKVDNKQTDRQNKNSIPPIIWYGA